MRRRRVLLAPLLGSPLASGLAACGKDEVAAVGSAGPGTLAFGLATAPRNLDPRLATDAVSERVNRLLYRRLVELDGSSLPVPGIASWERLSPTRWRFGLGDLGRSFADGARLDSRDVAATYRSILEPATGSPHRTLLSIVEGIETPDPDTVDFAVREPDPLFPAYLGIGLLPAAGIAAGRRFAEHPLGSGPFRLLDRPGPGRLRLARRRDGQVLELVTVKDPNVRVMKLLRGEIHLLQNDLSPELIRFLKDRGSALESVRVDTCPGVNFSYLGFNLADPLAGLLQVRQALAHAIDRESLVRHLFGGRARPAEGLLPPEHWAGHPHLPSYGHDPERARALLAQVGFGPDRPLDLTLKTTGDPFRVRLAAAIQAQAASAGIRLAIRSYDWGTFFGDVKAGRFQLFALTWVGVRTPDIFRYAYHSASVPPAGANRGRYSSPEADALIAAARSEAELSAQAPIYRRLAERLHADLPCLGLWYEDQVVAARTGVQGYSLAPDGSYDALEGVEPASQAGGLL